MNLRVAVLAGLAVAAAGPGFAAPPLARPEVEIDYRAGKVVRRDAAGKVLWSKELSGDFSMHREPHLLADAKRVYVSHGGGVSALDRKTGKLLWHAAGQDDRLLLSGDLLLSTDCTSGRYVEAGRWLVARQAATGTRVFRVALPIKDFDPNPIREVAGLFLVQTHEDPRGKGAALLVDRTGKVRHRFDRDVLDGRMQGKDRVFLTNRDVVRVAADGKVVWATAFPKAAWPAGGGLLEGLGGDLVAYLYGRISDSGVQVLRLDPKKGKALWSAKCAPLGVGHSKYRHRASVALEGGRLRVRSDGSAGSFTEVLDLRSGRRLERKSDR